MPALSSIDGINSGLKTTEIIDNLIQIARRPAVLMEKQGTEKTNIITAMKAFQAKLLAFSTEVGNLARPTAFNAFKVKVSDETVLGATTSGSVSTGSYDVQVLSVARNNVLASQGFTDQSTSLLGTGSITIGVGTATVKTITIDATNNSLVGIKKAINDAKGGVTASIVNDGSSSKAYRLILTADKTGQSNKMIVTSNLTGGSNLNYATALFDNPETITKNATSNAVISLGSTAAFTGSTNKTYTFTVAGTGAKTTGTDNITLNWTDGTNSGSIVITQADAEVALVGSGSEGLKLSLGAGTLYGGDKFQVSTFAPLLQEAADAKLAVGTSGGSGSPITITSSSNEFANAMGGITLTAKKVSPAGTSVNVAADLDVSGLKDKVTSLIKAYNDVNDYINTQNTYKKDSKESGVLFGDYTLQSIQNSLRSVISGSVRGIKSKYNQVNAIGIRFDAKGNLVIRDTSRFDKALKEDLQAVVDLFTSAGKTSRSNIEFVSSSEKTKMGEIYDVDITRAAQQGSFIGSSIADPATTPITLNNSNNRIKLAIDSLYSDEMILSEKTYSSADELVAEIQDKINNDGKIGSRGLRASWVSAGVGIGYIQFTSPTYGSTSKVNIMAGIANPGYRVLGLEAGASNAGVDVAGTINGEAAEGVGQFLTGKERNLTTDGLKLRITLDGNQLAEGADGTVTPTKGVAAKLNDLVSSMTRSGDGILDRKIKGYEGQVTALKTRIEEFDKRLAARRESLLKQYYAMEKTLGQLSSQGQYLTGQLASLNNNWNFNNSNN